MNDRDTLFQAILNEPDDIGLRLVYADLLEEEGDAARAEFIRVQCRLAEIAEDDEGRPELLAREQHLLSRHRNAWLGPFAQFDAAEDNVRQFPFQFQRPRTYWRTVNAGSNLPPFRKPGYYSQTHRRPRLLTPPGWPA